MKNAEVSAIFRSIAEILEIKGANRFRIRAYERAAQNIEGLSEDIESLIQEDRLREIPGIGHDLAERIKEFQQTGKIRMYEDLKKSIPDGLLDLLNIPSVGPKTAKLLHEKLNIKNIPDLKKAIKQNKLQGIFGIKEKTVENILSGIRVLELGQERMTLAEAALLADEFVKPLSKLSEVKRIAVAGSLRRQKETVRDIDMLVVSAQPRKIMQAFVELPLVKDILAQGETKASVRTQDGAQVDCRVVEAKSFGAALLYFTGSKNFNIKLRQLAIKKGLKLNEYGLFKKDKFIAGSTEENMFSALGLAYIEPELREDNGEVEIARNSDLPKLVELKDIKSDLHVHSRWSDGSDTIAKIAETAKSLGYSHIAITDHSQSLKIASGLSIADLKKKKRQINDLNKQIKDFKILYGAEVDIDSRGRLDYPDSVLEGFDLVVGAIHSGFKQSRSQLTKRLIAACENKYVHIIAHPTGRLWGSRDAYDIDFGQLLKVARQTRTSLEINAFPQRMDLNSLNCRRAKDMGVKLAIGTDSHSIEQLEAMRFGVSVARRGWLEKGDLLNTFSPEKFLQEIEK